MKHDIRPHVEHMAVDSRPRVPALACVVAARASRWYNVETGLRCSACESSRASISLASTALTKATAGNAHLIYCWRQEKMLLLSALLLVPPLLLFLSEDMF